jgi:hypothetical protein
MAAHNPYGLNPDLSIKLLNIASNMQKVIVIENLLQNPQALIQFAAENNFEPYPRIASGKGYPGVRLTPPNEYSLPIAEFIKPIIQKEFGIIDDIEMRKSECAISLITTKPEDLGTVQRLPHFDTSNTNQFAALLYLCDGSHGGTAFYRHNATGLEFITPQTSEYYLNIFFAELEKQHPPPEYFSNSDERFTKIGFLPAAVNRMVIYRSCVLHSPYINPEKSVDSDPRTGRLTVNSFVAF